MHSPAVVETKGHVAVCGNNSWLWKQIIKIRIDYIRYMLYGFCRATTVDKLIASLATAFLFKHAQSVFIVVILFYFTILWIEFPKNKQ